MARGVSQRYPIPHLSASTVRRLIGRARRDHFFHIPGYAADVSCSGAATVYVRIRAAGINHTVEVYGYLDRRHPALSDLLQALEAATRMS
ncbi:MAG: hypothetical protein DLM70_19085 [Chloroflexi bacterium]|nr:MAG: hypothetical protein DLM70_19085 [Chloroflexota bacterium]